MPYTMLYRKTRDAVMPKKYTYIFKPQLSDCYYIFPKLPFFFCRSFVCIMSVDGIIL